MFTVETVNILDQSDELSSCIKESLIYQEYQEAKYKLETDLEVKILRQKFDQIKSHYDDCLRFGRYHPDYSRVMKETRQQKRAYEIHPVVSNFKTKETALQDLLDEVISIVSYSISNNVKVDTGNPFFSSDSQGGGCATGGSCGCSS
ncbi:YlbF family regulator [Mammaliicoccus fleurettii]|uniref:YlbF family regulator n=1 Tax=Mammaliicoccus fleurettii TaxID=150056 RepID=UPI002DBE22BA|nr:YlbF family regulator [Mammaliicoccus fleurettii]MEB6202593.1 YlbF family regulator [Mammaliicoccus fleurettii]